MNFFSTFIYGQLPSKGKTLAGLAHSFRLFICTVLIWQMVFLSWAQAQEIILDPNGNVGFRPVVRQGTNAPVVDISQPNSSGVSVNQYSSFSVGQSGVVLNNSVTGGTSVLNGTVAANPNLSGGAADTIVTEVTSNVASSLMGAQEVAGQRADVIIANPNDITYDGCSFINSNGPTKHLFVIGFIL